MMIGEINRKKQEGNLVSYFGFTLPKMLRIFHEYRRLYPCGRLHIFALATFALALIGLISLAVCIFGPNQPRAADINSLAEGDVFTAPPVTDGLGSETYAFDSWTRVQQSVEYLLERGDVSS
jgi:hypothetical protein